MADIQQLVDEWIERTEHDLSFSPGPVQDLLFELWGALEHEVDARVEVERWLTLSLSRHLFGVEEIRELLLHCKGALAGASA